ncbi:zinc finger protein 572 isoform X2 [Oryzias latipes]|uniref:zinc finger protein 572 isoform X2 n=1 Tax=Oryzias latipes TaxID=8090 RepID=UPI0005CBE504|nr:zinc finger protein 572 isoform X2 [Oryzias latipes]
MVTPLPPSSLRLLIPPIRVLAAAMWQLAQQQRVEHYGKLEDFVSLVTEAVPHLLTDRQRSLLLLALRAKVALFNPTDVHHHLKRVQAVFQATEDTDVKQWCTSLSSLVRRMTQVSDDIQRLLQEVFDQSFDSALLSLVSDFLSRMEQLFPVPDFKQAASWLEGTPAGLEAYVQEGDEQDLTELLSHPSCRLGNVTTTVGSSSEEIFLSAWSHPLVHKLTNPDLPPCEVQPSADVQDLDVELVKVEVGMTMDEEQEHLEEIVIGPSSADNEESNQRSAADSIESSLSRCKDSPGNTSIQPEDTGGDVDHSGSNALQSISHNSQRVAHKCPQCAKCFIYRSQVIRHLRSNRSCSAALSSPNAAKEPRPVEPRPVRAYTCFQCSLVFKAKAELLSHQRSHRARPFYRCEHCDKAFHHLSSLTNHKQIHLDQSRFACSQCNKVFESAERRDAHLTQHELPKLNCSVCKQTFVSQALLLRHLQTHSAEGAVLRYNCLFCDQSFSGVTLLRIHQRSHTPRTYRCDQCNKSYASLTILQAHQLTHRASARYLCPQCGKSFKTRHGLECHLRTHSGERPYCCPYCPKDFTAIAGLNVHMRRHTGERPYVCTVCGKGWPSGGDLQKHMRSHTGERPYVCQYCGKGFSMSCHLTEHRRIHTGEKPYSCPDCGKCLRRKFDLNKHLLSHSNVRPHTCPLCPKSYTRKTHLSRHLLTHRPAEAGRHVQEESSDI